MRNLARIAVLRQEIDALEKLQEFAGWRLLEKEFVRAFEEHEAAVTDVKSTPEKRAEHVQAYHLSKTLKTWLTDQLEKRRSELAPLLQQDQGPDEV